MNTLYNIFKNEQERLRDRDIDIFYSEANRSIQYRDPNGTLTILFKGGDRNIEDFYFRRAEEKHSGLGFKFQFVYDNGEHCKVDKSIFEVAKASQQLCDIAQDYYFRREEIGIDIEPERAKAHKSHSKNTFER